MDIVFDKANENQKKAILCTEGPLLIIAGPGTGKTYTLINRALNLIVNKHVSPSNIMMVTFTDKAANEMTSRLSDALNQQGLPFNHDEMRIGTFHSICLQYIKENLEYSSLKKNFNLMDQFDEQFFIYRNFSAFKAIDNFDEFFPKRGIWDTCSLVMSVISRLTEELIDYHDLINSRNSTFMFYGRLLEMYECLRIRNNLLDFSSIQVEFYRMLMGNPQLLKKVQGEIKYLMVDEYQDTNHIQEKISNLIAEKSKNICVVGDDDQAIYRFRGATVRNILEFPKSHPGCTIVNLDINYRSNKGIVDFYNDWMHQTSGRDFKFDWGNFRFDKRIIPGKKDMIISPSVIQLSTKQKDLINEKVLNFINTLVDGGYIKNINQICFLFRSVKSESVKNLASFLENHGIPVYSPRSNMFFDREEVKVMIGMLLMLFPDYLRELNNLGEGQEYLKTMKEYYFNCKSLAIQEMNNPDNSDLLNWYKQRFVELNTMTESVDFGFSRLIYEMLEFTPMSGFLSVDLSKPISDSRQARNVSLLINLVIKFEYLYHFTIFTVRNKEKTVNSFFNTYFRFLFEGGISEYEDDEDYAPSGCVSFMTIHQSKGLEFPIVIIGSQSATPRKDFNVNIETIIEKFSGRQPFECLENIKYFDFWRLFYVGFSRAQSLLVLLCDASKPNEPSKYFEGLYEDLPYDLDYSDFNFEELKLSKIKKSYAFTTDLYTYMVCPTQYKFYRELGFEHVRVGNTLFGTVVHQTLEDINKKAIAGETEQITPENIKNWFDINYMTASKADNAYLSETLLKAALREVNSYYDIVKRDWSKIKQAELPINYSTEKFILNGKIDLVTSENGKYEIIDFKTEPKPDMNKDYKKINRAKKQLEIYAYLYEHRYGIKISSMKAYYTGEKNGVPSITFERTEENLNRTIEAVNEIVDKIEKKDFKGKCDDLNICKNCDFKFYCRKLK